MMRNSIAIYTGAYRKLLFQNEVTSSNKSNCLNDVTKILTVSSGGKSHVVPINREEVQMLQNYNFEWNLFDGDEYSGELDFLLGREKEATETLKENSLAYLAGVIEAKVIRKLSRAKNACQQCINVFLENELTDDNFMAFLSQKQSKIVSPCKSTIQIFSTVENFLEKHQSKNVSYYSVLTYIVNNIDMPQLYVSSNFDEDHDHKTDLVKQVIQAYLDHKSITFSKTLTTLSQKKLIRHDRLKQVHQLGQ